MKIRNILGQIFRKNAGTQRASSSPCEEEGGGGGSPSNCAPPPGPKYTETSIISFYSFLEKISEPRNIRKVGALRRIQWLVSKQNAAATYRVLQMCHSVHCLVLQTCPSVQCPQAAGEQTKCGGGDRSSVTNVSHCALPSVTNVSLYAHAHHHIHDTIHPQYNACTTCNKYSKQGGFETVGTAGQNIIKVLGLILRWVPYGASNG
jgi:hypothetical protein